MSLGESIEAMEQRVVRQRRKYGELQQRGIELRDAININRLRVEESRPPTSIGRDARVGHAAADAYVLSPADIERELTKFGELDPSGGFVGDQRIVQHEQFLAFQREGGVPGVLEDIGELDPTGGFTGNPLIVEEERRRIEAAKPLKARAVLRDPAKWPQILKTLITPPSHGVYQQYGPGALQRTAEVPGIREALRAGRDAGHFIGDEALSPIASAVPKGVRDPLGAGAKVFGTALGETAMQMVDMRKFVAAHVIPFFTLTIVDENEATQLLTDLGIMGEDANPIWRILGETFSPASLMTAGFIARQGPIAARALRASADAAKFLGTPKGNAQSLAMRGVANVVEPFGGTTFHGRFGREIAAEVGFGLGLEGAEAAGVEGPAKFGVGLAAGITGGYSANVGMRVRAGLRSLVADDSFRAVSRDFDIEVWRALSPETIAARANMQEAGWRQVPTRESEWILPDGTPMRSTLGDMHHRALVDARYAPESTIDSSYGRDQNNSTLLQFGWVRRLGDGEYHVWNLQPARVRALVEHSAADEMFDANITTLRIFEESTAQQHVIPMSTFAETTSVPKSINDPATTRIPMTDFAPMPREVGVLTTISGGSIDADSIPQVAMVPTEGLTTRASEMQARNVDVGESFNEASVQNIVDNYDPNKFTPLDVARDQATGELVVISGHHRLEAARRLGLTEVAVRIIEADLSTPAGLARAKRLAVEGNLGIAEQSPEELYRSFAILRDTGMTVAQIKNSAPSVKGPDVQKILDMGDASPAIIEAVGRNPQLFGIGAEVGRAAKIYGFAAEEASGIFADLIKVGEGETLPSASAARNSLDFLGRLSKHKDLQVKMLQGFDGQAQLGTLGEDTLSPIRALFRERVKLQSALQKELRQLQQFIRAAARLSEATGEPALKLVAAGEAKVEEIQLQILDIDAALANKVLVKPDVSAVGAVDDVDGEIVMRQIETPPAPVIDFEAGRTDALTTFEAARAGEFGLPEPPAPPPPAGITEGGKGIQFGGTAEDVLAAASRGESPTISFGPGRVPSPTAQELPLPSEYVRVTAKESGSVPVWLDSEHSPVMRVRIDEAGPRIELENPDLPLRPDISPEDKSNLYALPDDTPFAAFRVEADDDLPIAFEFAGGTFAELRVAINDWHYGTGARVKGFQVEYIMGPPASGKSHIAEPLAAEKGMLLIDADQIKKVLPGYNGGVGANYVHRESVNIAQAVKDRAIEAGDSFVIQGTGRNLDKTRAELVNLHELGYETHVTLVHAEPPAVADRIVSRWKKTGRVTPVANVLEGGFEPLRTYDTLVREGVDGVTGFEAFDSTTFPIGPPVESIGARLGVPRPRGGAVGGGDARGGVEDGAGGRFGEAEGEAEGVRVPVLTGGGVGEGSLPPDLQLDLNLPEPPASVAAARDAPELTPTGPVTEQSIDEMLGPRGQAPLITPEMMRSAAPQGPSLSEPPALTGTGSAGRRGTLFQVPTAEELGPEYGVKDVLRVDKQMVDQSLSIRNQLRSELRDSLVPLNLQRSDPEGAFRLPDVPGRPAFGDVIENPNAYDLTGAQRSALQQAGEVLDRIRAERVAFGVEGRLIKIDPDGSYFPRAVASRPKDGADIPTQGSGGSGSKLGGTSGKDAVRRFATVEEGLRAGVKYKHPMEALDDYAEKWFGRAKNAHLKDLFVPMSDSAALRVSPAMRSQMNGLKTAITSLRTSSVRLSRKEDDLLRAFVDSPEPNLDALTGGLENIRISQGRNVGLNLPESYKKIDELLTEVRELRPRYAMELEFSKSPGPGRGTVSMEYAPGLAGRDFDIDVADRINNYYGAQRRGRVRQFAQDYVNVPVRFSNANMDVSSILRQQIEQSVSHPKIYTRNVMLSFRDAVDPADYDKLVGSERGRHAAKRGIALFGEAGQPAEFQSATWMHRIPLGVGRAFMLADAHFTRFNTRMRVDVFHAELDIYSRKLGRDLTAIEEDQIARAVNRSTGVSWTRGSSLESDAMFASRYTRASIESVVKAVSDGGLEGQLARRYIRNLVSTTAFMVTAVALAQGRDLREVLNPIDMTALEFGEIRLNPNFMSVRVFGHDVKPLGAYDSTARLIFVAGDATRRAILEKDAHQLFDFIGYAAATKGSPLISLGADIIKGETFMGSDPLTPGALGERVLPFGAQNLIEDIRSGTDDPVDLALGVFLEGLGAKTSPMTRAERRDSDVRKWAEKGDEDGNPRLGRGGRAVGGFWDLSPSTRKAFAEEHPYYDEQRLDRARRRGNDPVSQRILARTNILEDRLEEEAGLVSMHRAGLSGRDFREKYNDIQERAAQRTAGVYDMNPTTVERDPADDYEAALDSYYEVFRTSLLPDGSLDSNQVDERLALLEREWAAGGSAGKALRQYVEENIGTGEHAPGLEQFIETKRELASTGFFRISEMVWDAMKADPGSQQFGLAYFKSYYEWRNASIGGHRYMLEQQGLDKGNAYQQAPAAMGNDPDKEPVMRVFGEMRKQYEQAWMEGQLALGRGDLIDNAQLYDYLSTDRSERQALHEAKVAVN